ncbi:MAG: hypothetical protein ACI8WP_001411 [Flavobacteriaceae bacterium]
MKGVQFAPDHRVWVFLINTFIYYIQPMEKKFLLGVGGGLDISQRISRVAYYVIGFVQLIAGLISLLTKESVDLWALLMILTGVFALFMATTGFSEKSRLSPKVIISDEFIGWKTTIFGSVKSLNWNEVKTITLEEYKVVFFLSDGTTKILAYHTEAEVSKSIKAEIRAKADQKTIPVLP